MKEKIKQFISHITFGEGHKAKSQFESIIREKIRQSLETKKIEIGKNLYVSKTIEESRFNKYSNAGKVTFQGDTITK